MIPIRLALRNFMCYRDNVPPLNFDGIHLACLSGDNGNGKSALIDAMTWALWGRTRAKSDDDLIHSGQPEMTVEFDFAVAQQPYRIIRKRARPKQRSRQGQSILELQIASDGGFRQISGTTIAQTQQKIIDILHMDYDTFVNSAFLRQGHADEFTRQAPAKRKEVLGSILGLEAYDALEDRAKDLFKKYEADTLQLENALKDITAELARKPEYEAELAQAQSSLSAIDALAGEKEKFLEGLRQKKETLEKKQAQLVELEARIASNTRDLQLREEQVAQHLARIKKYEEVISRREVIEKGYTQFTEAKRACEELDKQFRQSVSLDKQKNHLESRIDKARNQLTTDHTVTLKEISALEEKTKNLPGLKDRLSREQARMRSLEESEAAVRKKEDSVKEIQAQVNYLEGEIGRLEREIKEAGEKLDLIASHLASHTAAKCPLCEQDLTREGLELIAAKYNREKDEKSGLLSENRTALSKKKAEYDAAQKERVTLELKLKQEKAAVQGQIGALMKNISDIEEEGKKLAGLRETLDEIERSLAGRDFAAAEQQALAAIEKELAELRYDPARHEAARQQFNELGKYDEDKRGLDEALKLIDQEKESAARAQAEAQGKRESLQMDSSKQETLTTELVQLPQVRRELSAAEFEYKDLTSQRSRAQEIVGSVKEKLQRIAGLEVKKKEKEGQMSHAAEEGNIYRELARAFGKGGIQALLIETALPEIEVEANRLLGRMTDNRMHLKFETQRETKKGNVTETLDINISDELGTRNYEMFSGGEAFRINFAIRIALSRLLARRAGAPLPTLIIDEGFGTQDNAGLEKLKEAINSIQDDFEKIIVITHIEELRDAFPTRIDVIKTAEGSTISVS